MISGSSFFPLEPLSLSSLVMDLYVLASNGIRMNVMIKSISISICLQSWDYDFDRNLFPGNTGE